MPSGDQIIGVIDEYYAALYASEINRDSKIYYAHRVAGTDLVIQSKAGDISRVQVKTVSASSRTHRLSPINCGWDELWLLRLNNSLRPEAFWTLSDNTAFNAEVSWKNLTMPRRIITEDGYSTRYGSKIFANAQNCILDDRLDDLQAVISETL